MQGNSPIEPGRTEYELRNAYARVIDAATQGFYSYPPGAISPSCGRVSLEIFSEKRTEYIDQAAGGDLDRGAGVGGFRAVS